MKTYLVVYTNGWYDIQKVEGVWDLNLREEYQNISIIEITKEMLEDLKKIES